ncbi:MAG: hypothetical protein M3Y35_11000 [Actinomycetota bacterium]|nr:hypothetical protein [Actinomycetota bacterium]
MAFPGAADAAELAAAEADTAGADAGELAAADVLAGDVLAADVPAAAVLAEVEFPAAVLVDPHAAVAVIRAAVVNAATNFSAGRAVVIGSPWLLRRWKRRMVR